MPKLTKTARRRRSQLRAAAKISKKPNKKGVQLYSTSNSGIFTVTKPSVANSGTAQDITTLDVRPLPPHLEYGMGVRVTGRQYFVAFTTEAAANGLFVTGTATATTTNLIYCSPDTMNGRLALMARNYVKYAFRRIRIDYVPRVATSQAGSYAFGYAQDGAIVNQLTTSYSFTTQMVPSMLGPFREFMCMEMVYNGTNTWFCEFQNADDSSTRLTAQGAFVGFPDVTSIGAVTQGQTFVTYTIDLYQPTNDLGFSKIVSTHPKGDEVDYLLDQLKTFRLARSRAKPTVSYPPYCTCQGMGLCRFCTSGSSVISLASSEKDVKDDCHPLKKVEDNYPPGNKLAEVVSDDCQARKVVLAPGETLQQFWNSLDEQTKILLRPRFVCQGIDKLFPSLAMEDSH